MMMQIAPLKKIPLLFYKNLNGNEPVRDWLKELPGSGTPRHRP
jgi:hypothetical protein